MYAVQSFHPGKDNSLMKSIKAQYDQNVHAHDEGIYISDHSYI